MTAAPDYVRAGLALVPIPRGRKGPTAKGWQTRERCILSDDQAQRVNGGNLGLAHAYCTPSPTCALDVDDFEAAEGWLRDRGIDLTALLAVDGAVQIRSGRPGRAKLLYRLPHALATVQPEGSGLELRCASRDGATMQDVLPPSIHPDTGRPYEWLGDWQHIPEIPAALLALWQSKIEAPRAKATSPVQSDTELMRDLRSALTAIRADDYHEWVRIGHALKMLGDPGRSLWLEWSSTSDKYDAADAARRWNSFEPRATGHEAVFAAAQASGWVNPAKGKGKPKPAPQEPPVHVLEQIPDAAPDAARYAPETPGEQIIAPTPDGPRVVSLNEDNVARVFAHQHAGRLLFDHDRGRWHSWDSARWRPDGTDLALHYARELCRELNSEGRKQFAKAATFAAVERIARADRVFAVTADAWDADPWLLATPAGTVDLRTGTMRAASPEDRITRLTAVAPEDRDPALWLGFLDEATQGDADMIEFLRRFAGYSLTGSTAEECLAFAYGPGGNGKGVFIGTLTGAWGEYAAWAAMDTFIASKFEKHSTDLAMLAGARLVVASETTEGRSWDEGRIKALTGGDHVTARFMRRDNFTFTPQFKLLLVGNHKPSLRSVDAAARRRFHIVPFLNAPAERDPTLKDRLRHEWGAILRWAIEGCMAWQRDGLKVPKRVRDETEAYFAAQDVFGSWLDECTDRRVNSWDTHGRLFGSWARYAETNHEPAGSARAFTDRLESRGFARGKFTHGARGFRGLALRVADGGTSS